MDVEKIWPDDIPSIKAAQTLDHIQDWAQSCFYSSHVKNQGQEIFEFMNFQNYFKNMLIGCYNKSLIEKRIHTEKH